MGLLNGETCPQEWHTWDKACSTVTISLAADREKIVSDLVRRIIHKYKDRENQ